MITRPIGAQLAALAPCVLGYGEIGLRLAKLQGDTPYSGWIETYAGAEYQQMCHETGTLLDAAVQRRLGKSPETAPRWRSLQHRFETATRLEVDSRPLWRLSIPSRLRC